MIIYSGGSSEGKYFGDDTSGPGYIPDGSGLIDPDDETHHLFIMPSSGIRAEESGII